MSTNDSSNSLSGHVAVHENELMWYGILNKMLNLEIALSASNTVAVDRCVNKDKKINIKTVNVTVKPIINGTLGTWPKLLLKKMEVMRDPKNWKHSDRSLRKVLETRGHALSFVIVARNHLFMGYVNGDKCETKKS